MEKTEQGFDVKKEFWLSDDKCRNNIIKYRDSDSWGDDSELSN